MGFPQFVRRSLDAHMDSNGNINSWTFYNTSLPHVLLASLTDTLLPILPSLDDYMCLICTSIAFKPIRLNCSHLFCVRYVDGLLHLRERGPDHYQSALQMLGEDATGRQGTLSIVQSDDSVASRSMSVIQVNSPICIINLTCNFLMCSTASLDTEMMG